MVKKDAIFGYLNFVHQYLLNLSEHQQFARKILRPIVIKPEPCIKAKIIFPNEKIVRHFHFQLFKNQY